MKDVLEDGGLKVKPLSVLAHGASAAVACMIVYNAFFGQHEAARIRTAQGLSTRVDVAAGQASNTIVLRYDPKVEEIQRGLLALGDYQGMVDGVAGRQTKLAIEAYQRKAGLAVDGEVSDALLENLRFTREIAEAAQFTGSIEKPTPKANGKQLLEVQTALAELGYQPGEITGDMTEATRSAIIMFQKDRGLAEDGEVSIGLLNEMSKMSE
jgi:peptidoglycan hydrolase-like protein with peptidoglycan-binding domain